MFGVGMPELMIIFVIALLVFGPKELPKIAKTLGKAMSELRRASDELRDGIQREIDIATREEKETPPSLLEPVPSGNMGDGSAAVADAQGGVGAETVVAGDPGAKEQGSQEVAEASLPALDEQPGQSIKIQAAAPSNLPAEPAQTHVPHEEVMSAAGQTVPEETPKEPSSVPEAAQHAPTQPAETRNA